MKTLTDLLDGIDRDVAAGRIATMTPTTWPGPIRPVMFTGASGSIPRPLVWQARLLRHISYHDFKCCDQWTSVIYWYEWEALFSNDRSGPFPMPRIRETLEGSGFNCFEEFGWPQTYTMRQSNAGLANELTGDWAINTAEFTYDHRLARGPSLFDQGICAREDKRCAVGMMLGEWIDPHRCIQDPNVPGSAILEQKMTRVVPFFHRYKAQLHDAC